MKTKKVVAVYLSALLALLCCLAGVLLVLRPGPGKVSAQTATWDLKREMQTLYEMRAAGNAAAVSLETFALVYGQSDATSSNSPAGYAALPFQKDENHATMGNRLIFGGRAINDVAAYANAYVLEYDSLKGQGQDVDTAGPVVSLVHNTSGSINNAETGLKWTAPAMGGYKITFTVLCTQRSVDGVGTLNGCAIRIADKEGTIAYAKRSAAEFKEENKGACVLEYTWNAFAGDEIYILLNSLGSYWEDFYRIEASIERISDSPSWSLSEEMKTLFDARLAGASAQALRSFVPVSGYTNAGGYAAYEELPFWESNANELTYQRDAAAETRAKCDMISYGGWRAGKIVFGLVAEYNEAGVKWTAPQKGVYRITMKAEYGAGSFDASKAYSEASWDGATAKIANASGLVVAKFRTFRQVVKTQGILEFSYDYAAEANQTLYFLLDGLRYNWGDSYFVEIGVEYVREDISPSDWDMRREIVATELGASSFDFYSSETSSEDLTEFNLLPWRTSDLRYTFAGGGVSLDDYQKLSCWFTGKENIACAVSFTAPESGTYLLSHSLTAKNLSANDDFHWDGLGFVYKVIGEGREITVDSTRVGHLRMYETGNAVAYEYSVALRAGDKAVWFIQNGYTWGDEYTDFNYTAKRLSDACPLGEAAISVPERVLSSAAEESRIAVSSVRVNGAETGAYTYSSSVIEGDKNALRGDALVAEKTHTVKILTVVKNGDGVILDSAASVVRLVYVLPESVAGTGKFIAYVYGGNFFKAGTETAENVAAAEYVPVFLDMRSSGKASLRMGTNSVGIRFIVDVEVNETLTLLAASEKVEFGTRWYCDSLSGSLDISAAIWMPYAEGDAVRSYTGVLVDLTEKYYDYRFSVAPYIRITYADGISETLFFEKSAQNSVRAVAAAAVNDLSDTPDENYRTAISFPEGVKYSPLSEKQYEFFAKIADAKKEEAGK